MGLLSGLGKVVGAVFGSKGSKQSSKNEAYPFISSTYSPQATGGVNAFNAYGNALGLGPEGSAAQQGAFQNYLSNVGQPYIMDEAMKGLTNSAAGNFFLRSGATAKGLQDRGFNIAKTYYDNYLNHISDMSKLGLGAGNLIGQTGQVSSGTAGGSNGIGSALGTALQIASIASDRRLKTAIEPVGALSDGLPVYEYTYRRDIDPTLPEGRIRGVMADEVAELRPWALGPVRPDGYSTVNYGVL